MMGEIVAANTLTNLRAIRGNEFDKWLIPPYSLDDKVPKYHNGPLFTIPRWSIPCLAAAMWKSPIVYIDDIYSAGLLPQACKVKREGVKDWNGHGSNPIPGPEVKDIKFDPKFVMWHLGSTNYGSDCKHRFYHEHTNIK